MFKESAISRDGTQTGNGKAGLDRSTDEAAVFRYSGGIIHLRAYWTVLGIVWILNSAYMASNLKRGWIPWDEGAYGQSAERI